MWHTYTCVRIDMHLPPCVLVPKQSASIETILCMLAPNRDDAYANFEMILCARAHVDVITSIKHDLPHQSKLHDKILLSRPIIYMILIFGFETVLGLNSF